MSQKLKVRLDRAFRLTQDLFAHLDEASLKLDLPNVPSNSIAGQVWCIVGARESYTKAIAAGEWKGFACSLKEPGKKQSVLAALDSSRAALDAIDFFKLTEKQSEITLDLLEHEIQHHGQLIRYVYANKLSFPKSWNERYTV
ncbi:MAG: hypothetical protein WAW96_18095 [Alphaproteobacteria bacterium]